MYFFFISSFACFERPGGFPPLVELLSSLTDHLLASRQPGNPPDHVQTPPPPGEAACRQVMRALLHSLNDDAPSVVEECSRKAREVSLSFLAASQARAHPTLGTFQPAALRAMCKMV